MPRRSRISRTRTVVQVSPLLLAGLGWTDGRNVRIDLRSGGSFAGVALQTERVLSAKTWAFSRFRAPAPPVPFGLRGAVVVAARCPCWPQPEESRNAQEPD